jgi:hypothetical protein
LPLTLRAQEIEVIELRHRSAEQLLPLLQPLVEPGGALTGRGYQLFLRASPANRRQLRGLLASLDTPPRQLRITVRQELADERRRDARGADGSVTIGTRGIDAEATARAGNSRSVSTQDAMQQVRVLEGASAYIEVGTAVPMTFRQWVATPQGLTEVFGTAHVDAVTGFYARPQLAGDEVTLELSPAQSTIAASGFDRAQLQTTVRGRLGEWIAVGGAELRRESQRNGMLGTDLQSQSASRGVWLMVESVEAADRR